MLEFEDQVRKLIKEYKYFQFSASWCPDCRYALSIWDRFNVTSRVHIFDIGSLPKDDQEKWRVAFNDVTGSRNLPTIFVDGKIWGTERELHNHEDNGTLEIELKRIGLL